MIDKVRKEICKECDIYVVCSRYHKYRLGAWLYKRMPRLWKFIKKL